VFTKIRSVLRYLEFTREETFLPTGVNFVWDTLIDYAKGRWVRWPGYGMNDQGTVARLPPEERQFSPTPKHPGRHWSLLSLFNGYLRLFPWE